MPRNYSLKAQKQFRDNQKVLFILDKTRKSLFPQLETAETHLAQPKTSQKRKFGKKLFFKMSTVVLHSA